MLACNEGKGDDFIGEIKLGLAEGKEEGKRLRCVDKMFDGRAVELGVGNNEGLRLRSDEGKYDGIIEGIKLVLTKGKKDGEELGCVVENDPGLKG